MYRHLIRNHLYDEMSSLVILPARNIDVNEINKTVVSLLDTHNERVYDGWMVYDISYGSQIFSYLSQANIYKIHFQ